VLPSALLFGARTFLQRYLLRRRSPVRLGPAVSLPVDDLELTLAVLVEGLVGEEIGALVLLALDMLDLDVRK
jgi:hypothetical protein